MKLCLLLLSYSSLFAQDTLVLQKKSGSEHQIHLGHQQVLDEKNYGLVLRGGYLGYTYGYKRFFVNSKQQQRLLNAEVHLGLSYLTLQTPAPSTGFGCTLKPLDVYYGFEVFRPHSKKTNKLFLGPQVSFTNSTFLYPDLNTGHPIWLSHLNLGVQAQMQLQKDWLFKASSTIIGWSSRPPLANNSYYFSLSPWQLLKSGYRDFQFGNVWQVHLEAQYLLKQKKRHNYHLAYSFDFKNFNGFERPNFQSINHEIKFIIK